ncbi:YhgE/Pip domain-containing protein [Aestuariimicrobium kwangyangense]|uniref:YhgE/Pip domain-containing protein n=1 Tax=Aestuariimicrobium kwangyangense TaxID=396389 RepID=UPI0003B5ED33|nr:YhgE/Pip domain-containing protein [Aestuariimicrobium kwangyangense]
MKNLSGWWKLAAAVLVPLLVAAAFLAGSWNAEHRTANVQAAIVNNDQAVTLNGQIVPLGRQLAVAMAERKGENVTWTLTDTSGAQQGLTSGDFAAVVTIPKNFSTAATGFSRNGDSGQQATIDVRTSPAAGVSDAAVAQQIAAIAADTLNRQLTSTYLTNIYVGFNEMGSQFVTLADGAKQLDTGATALSSGTTQASDGVNQLNTGVQQLNSGANQLGAGVQPLKDGGAQLTAGGAQLVQGGSQLTSGSSQLSGGAQQLATGVRQYADGTSRYVDGVSQLSGGLTQLQQGLAKSSSSELSTQLDQLAAGGDSLATGAQQLSGGIQTYQAALGKLKQQPAPVPTTIPGSDQVLAGCLAQGGTETTCAPVVAAYEQGFTAGMTGGWQAGLTAAEQGVTGAGDPSASLVGGAAGLATGAGKLSTGLDQLATQLPQQLAAQQGQLTTAVDQLASGAQQLSSSGQGLKSGGTKLAAGADQLSSGAGSYTTGVAQYTTGVGTYVTGVGTYADGVDQFADGTSKVVAGVNQVAANTPALASGMSQLSSGADKLAEGVGAFSDGINAGKAKVPSYSPQQRENLSTVATRPVQNPTEGPVGASVVPLTIAVVAIGLWLGALVLSWVRATPPTLGSGGALGSTRSSAILLGRALLPGLLFAAVEAVVLGALGASVMHLSWTTSLRWTALVGLVAVAFVLVNHALGAWLGVLGRVLAIVAVTAAAAVSVTAAVPGVFSWVHGVTPLAPALTGLRDVVAGESPVAAVGALLAWGLVAFVASFLAVARQRSLTVKQYLALHPAAA